jgi:hypothetical protein
MSITDNILVPPSNIAGIEDNSDSFLVCSIIFKNNKYYVEGRKFGMDSIYWEVEELGLIITSNHSPIVFSNSELNTPDIKQTFTLWHEAGMGSLQKTKS